MKIVLFCSHRIAWFAYQALRKQGVLAGLVVTDSDPTFCNEAQAIAQIHHTPFTICSREMLTSSLENWLKLLAPDAALVMTFSYRIPHSLLQTPPKGFWNIHTGKLPEYRGPDPTFWQIRNNETAGALSLHKMTEEFDSGPILHQVPIPLRKEEILGSHQATAVQAADECVQALLDFLEGKKGELKEQDDTQSTYYPRPTLEDLTIHWDSMDGAEIERLVRATNPNYQGARTHLRGAEVSLHEVDVIPLTDPPQEKPGTVVESPDDPNLYILCRDHTCLRVDVASTTEAVCSGSSLRALFYIKSGERFT